MIPIKIREPSLRRSSFDLVENSSSLRTDIDLVEEVREQACIRQEIQLQGLTLRPRRVRPSLVEDKRHEEEKRREARDQLRRAFSNPRITQQWCIRPGIARQHNHPEDVEFYTPHYFN
ncbi:hypothetical protein CR513_10836, partial [Mucuna pruriens]